MSRSKVDWRSWTALAWALTFAILYVGTVIRERAPWIWSRWGG